MRTSKLLKLHKRATVILEMIERADMLAKEENRYVTLRNLTTFLSLKATLPFHQKRLAKYIEISKRLQLYYADVMQRLTDPFINNMKKLETVY